MAMGKVIKGDVVAVDAERGGSTVRPAPRPGVLSAEDFEARQAGNRILEDAKQRAEELLEQAKERADTVLADARREAETLREEARKRGHEEGMTQVTELLTRAKMQAGQLLASEATEREVLSLACKIAEKIIGRDLERDPTLLADICAQAVDQVRSARSVTLRVNPEDGRVLRTVSPRLMELIARTVDLSIKDDAEVERGGCIVQTEFGVIDAQLRTQFEMLRNVLLLDGVKSEGAA